MTLATTDVSMRFGGLLAVNQVSVTFPRGRITGLIGPNGSGKSTLVNIMSGQLRATAGRVALDDTDLTALRADQITARGLARTYQIPSLPPQLSIAEIIGVPLTYVRAPVKPLAGLRDPRSIAGFCGIRQSLDTRCAALPVPDLRRLEIARAIACGPTMLLLDEVMAGLSHEDSQQVVALIRRVHAAGIGVVVIEHVMRIIAALCEDVVVMNQGSVLRRGPPAEVLADPVVREVYLGRAHAA